MLKVDHRIKIFLKRQAKKKNPTGLEIVTLGVVVKLIQWEFLNRADF